jgi:hypothetical protein
VVQAGHSRERGNLFLVSPVISYDGVCVFVRACPVRCRFGYLIGVIPVCRGLPASGGFVSNQIVVRQNFLIFNLSFLFFIFDTCPPQADFIFL